MVSRHTIHHSKNKWTKASPENKNISKLQRQLNKISKLAEDYRLKIVRLKLAITKEKEYWKNKEQRG